MQIDSANAMIEALRVSGLISPDQFSNVVRDLTPLGEDVNQIVACLLANNHLTYYQLRKMLDGKASSLKLGSYIIEDRLGQGGMGRVYRARHVVTEEVVALKVVRSRFLTNPVVKRRYEREVETARTLDHPNLVRVVDAGEVGARYFLAMEFVDGIDLAKLLREFRPLEIAEACEYVRQAALGLQHAHEAGFVHRDIKPSNIIVAGERHIPEATGPALVKVLDMGLARAIGPEEGTALEDLTRIGTVVGTPDYMAPEQAKDSRAVDHHADIYSLGCTLYFLLTCQPPFAGGTAMEKILRHQVDPPAPVQALRPEVSSAVAGVLSRMLAKLPADRYHSAAEVAAELQPLTKHSAKKPYRTRPVGHRPPDSLATQPVSGSECSTITPSRESSIWSPAENPQPARTPRPVPRRPRETRREGSSSVRQSDTGRTRALSASGVTPAKSTTRQLRQPKRRANNTRMWVALASAFLLGASLLAVFLSCS